MLNPLSWKREHQAALAIAVVLGAVAGLFFADKLRCFPLPERAFISVQPSAAQLQRQELRRRQSEEQAHKFFGELFGKPQTARQKAPQQEFGLGRSTDHLPIQGGPRLVRGGAFEWWSWISCWASYLFWPAICGGAGGAIIYMRQLLRV